MNHPSRPTEPNPDHAAWINRGAEPPLNPDRPIIDAHHHLWDRADSRYLLDDLLADTEQGHQVTHTVFVECSASYDTASPAAMAPVGETRFVASQAEASAYRRVTAEAAAREMQGQAGDRRQAPSGRRWHSEIAAIVGHADLRLGAAVGDVLAAHIDAGRGRFRGVRHGVNWSAHSDVKNGHHDPAPSQLLDPAFRAGLAALAEHGLSFDAWLYFDQLGELAEAARAVPGTTMIVNHLGGPLGIGPHAGAGRLAMLEVWQRGIDELAECPNVVCKIGGLGMEHYFRHWAGRPCRSRRAPKSLPPGGARSCTM